MVVTKPGGEHLHVFKISYSCLAKHIQYTETINDWRSTEISTTSAVSINAERSERL